MLDYSASQAELGPSAGPDTWRACIDAVGDWNPLPDADALQLFRDWIRPWGGWDDSEIAAMSDDSLRALCIQWIAGDWRECFDCPPDAVDWSDYEARSMNGECTSSLYRDSDGSIYWTMEH